MKAIAETALYLALAPLLLAGYFAGLAWIGLASGFRLAGITMQAMGDDRHTWTVRITKAPKEAKHD